jgi:hypothetical protein
VVAGFAPGIVAAVGFATTGACASIGAALTSCGFTSTRLR